MQTGQIIEGRGGFYTVAAEDGSQVVLRAKKKFRHQSLTPLVGDRVRFIRDEQTGGWVEEILERKNSFVRPPVANVEKLCIVLSPEPYPDWLLVDKLLLTAQMQGITSLLAVNKVDLNREVLHKAEREYQKSGAKVLGVSALTGEGLHPLNKALQGGLCCFTGQSGAGKSTLLSALLGVSLESGEISPKIKRGRQTTRHTSLLCLRGLTVLDTPGFSLLETPEKMDPLTLMDYYPEFAPYQGQCRFAPCHHDREPGCAVTEAVGRGELDGERILRYRELLKEIQNKWRERYD